MIDDDDKILEDSELELHVRKMAQYFEMQDLTHTQVILVLGTLLSAIGNFCNFSEKEYRSILDKILESFIKLKKQI